MKASHLLNLLVLGLLTFAVGAQMSSEAALLGGAGITLYTLFLGTLEVRDGFRSARRRRHRLSA